MEKYDKDKKRQWAQDDSYTKHKELAKSSQSSKNIQSISKAKQEELYWQYLAPAFFLLDDKGVALVCPKCDEEIHEKRWSALTQESSFVYLKIESTKLLQSHECGKAKAQPKGWAQADLYEQFIEHSHSKHLTYPSESHSTSHEKLQPQERSYTPSPR